MAATTQSHMVPLPKAFLVLRIFQLVFAVAVFGICVYGAVYSAISGIVLNIFTALATVIYLIYLLVATYSQPIIYQYWAILALEIFCLVFWLISFAVLASEVAIGAAYSCGGGYYYYGYYVSTSCSKSALATIGLFGACAGIGALDFIFFIVSLAFFSVRLARHRSGGGHCIPGGMATAAPQLEKVEMQPQSQVQPVTATQPGYYPPQNIDPRYAAAPVMPDGQQYQPAPQEMQHQGVPAQYPQQQPIPVQYQQQIPQ